MIDIKALTESDKGRYVLYRRPHEPNTPDVGRITSWNDTYIFVAYGQSVTGVATRPDDLDWSFASIKASP